MNILDKKEGKSIRPIIVVIFEVKAE
jgi:hypothetical protein